MLDHLNSTFGPPVALPLVFTHERELYTSPKKIECIFDNDSFTEILNEDFDSYVMNPWSWNRNYGMELSKLSVVVVAIATLITNILVIVTFVREKLLSPINIILIGISVSDTLTVLVPALAIMYMFTDGLMPDYIPFEYCRTWGYLTKYLPTITHNASVWLTVVLAFDRWLAIRHPFLLRRMCLPKKSISIIVLIYIASILCHVCRFLDTEYAPVKIVSTKTWNKTDQREIKEFYVNTTSTLMSMARQVNDTYESVDTHKAVLQEICHQSQGVDTCRAVYKPIFGEFKYYEFCYYWFVILFVKFIPCITMVVLDTLMLRSLHQAEKVHKAISVANLNAVGSNPGASRKTLYESKRMTVITIIAIIIVVLVELPIGVILIFWTLAEIHGQEFITEASLSFFSRLANMIVYISYPIIFLLYCCISAKFRRSFCKFSICKYPRNHCTILELTSLQQSSSNGKVDT